MNASEMGICKDCYRWASPSSMCFLCQCGDPQILRAERDAAMESETELRAELAKVTAERDQMRERLVCACAYAIESEGMSEGQATMLLGVGRVECRTLIDEAKNIRWLTRGTPTEGE